MTDKAQSVVSKVMNEWKSSARHLSRRDYVEAAEDVVDSLESMIQAAKEEMEEEGED